MDSEDPLTHQLSLGEWRKNTQSTGFISLNRQGSNAYSVTAKNVRDRLYTYFNSEKEEVSWQYAMI